MAASGRLDSSSGNPDRYLHASGQRGSYTVASLDRSGNFRENMENPVLSAFPNMSRSGSAVTQRDLMNFFQSLHVDLKSLFSEHKLNRQTEIHQLTSVALGITHDEFRSGLLKSKPLAASSPEELKRLKVGLHGSSIKARERVKIFSEALSVFNKSFPKITSRKRSRSDVVSGERSNTSTSTDRSVSGTSIGRMAAQSHAIGSGFGSEKQKMEERTKIAVPNKRTRTSMVDLKADMKASTPSRPSGSVERDKELARVTNTSTVQGEDRSLSVSVDGWEKSKMKKKRSGIKPDVSPSAMVKPVDGYGETKQRMQPRLVTDARSRLNDPHDFRSGVVSGALGAGKADGTSQPAGLGMRSSIPRAEQDNNSLLPDRRERSNVLEKERANIGAVNKMAVQEDFSSGSPTSSSKLTATARAPRSGSGCTPKVSPMVQRTTAVNDWEMSHCVSKLPATAEATNRKRTPSTPSSSPPVTHWAGQRPHKSSRTARRTNLLPIVSSNDELCTLDTISDASGNDTGPGFVRRPPGNSPQQVKLKGDHFSSASLSESEESGAAEFRSNDKGKKVDESVQKVSTMVLPLRKNKVVGGANIGDGVRKQGRSGRGFTSTRSLMPMTVEKLGNLRTAKQLRPARLGFDKVESKAGRPPTRKLSERKAYTRQKHTTVHAEADFLVGSVDGQEELLAAANAVIDSAHAFSSPFWQQMEPFFGFVSDIDIAHLEQQENLGFSVAESTTLPLDVGRLSVVPNGFGLSKPVGDSNRRRSEMSPVNLALGIPTEISLYHTLMAAIISEEGEEELYSNGNEDLSFDIYGSEYELDTDLVSDTLNHQLFPSFELAGSGASNCYQTNASRRSFNEMEQNLSDGGLMAMQGTGIVPDLDLSCNGSISDQVLMPGKACSAYQYCNMSINEKILLEIQSIGLYPESLPCLAHKGDEEISWDICRLEEKYHEKASRKKALFGELLKSASETKALQEKEFERQAIDKLVPMAYEQYMACRGKSASSKMARHAALVFVERTLKRCQEFEETGKSCFSEPMFREMFLSGSSRIINAKTQDSITYDLPYEQAIFKGDAWSNKVKRKELVLDSVGGKIGASSNTAPGFGNSFSSNAKGKRSERDRDGKGNTREISRNGTAKISRLTSANIKGERKAKTKHKQKTAQLSTSINGLVEKLSDQPKATFTSVPKSTDITSVGSAKNKENFSLGVVDEHGPIDLSHLQIPEMDVLGGHGQDLDSWLNIEDDGLQDEDFMGLEIPMDDLADLNMI